MGRTVAVAWALAGILNGAWAHPPLRENSPHCVCDTRDPFDFGPVMPAGRFRGQCQNSCAVRSLHLSESMRTFNADAASDELVAANMSHLGRFYLARIPVEGIETALVERVWFPSKFPIAHVQLRLHFRDDAWVELEPQVPGDPRVRVRDLVFSAEPNAPRGLRAESLLMTLNNAFVLNYRLRTLDDVVQQRVYDLKERVEQYELSLSQDERASVLRRAVSFAAETGPFKPYHLWHRSCATELFFEILDKSLGPNHKPGHSEFSRGLARYPLYVVDALRQRHLIAQGQTSFRPTLKSEHLCVLSGAMSPDECLRHAPPQNEDKVERPHND